MSNRTVDVTPELVLWAYRSGHFPMAETRHGRRLYWLNPEERGVLPLDGFHLPRRLGRTVLSDRFAVTADRAFPAVIAGCAAAAPNRPDTWINGDIERLFKALHAGGHAHSVECWRDGALVGGLYGVAIGGAFFGESMFSTERDASKVALVHLVARLRLGGFALLDTQFVTAHLRQFGTLEVARDAYEALLAAAIGRDARWDAEPGNPALRAEFGSMQGSECAAR